MPKLIALVLVLALTSQGCILLAAGALGYLVARPGSKTAKHIEPKLTDIQRRNLETKEVEGNNREDVLRAVVTVFQDRGYVILSSDYTGGIISASNKEQSDLQITATIESFTEKRIKMRITARDSYGIIEDSKYFAKLYDDIQTEVFRRTNLK